MTDVLNTSASGWNLAENAANPAPGGIFTPTSPGNQSLSITLDLGLSGTTTWGLATGTSIRLNPDIFGWGPDFAQAVISHELGHTVGYQHVDGSCDSIMRQFMSPSSFTQWLSISDYNAVYFDYSPTYCGDPDTCSPLLLDLGQNGVDLTGPTVLFDITGTGQPSRIGWTPRGTQDGFLCLDRNGDGIIANGRELFGNVTPLSWSFVGPPAENGFAALAFFDDPAEGGNGNGLLDEGDRVFSRLLVWTDTDQNAGSRPEELRTLTDYGIASIALTYKVSMRKDEHGNLFRYRSRYMLGSPGDPVGAEKRHVWDVFLTGTSR